MPSLPLTTRRGLLSLCLASLAAAISGRGRAEDIGARFHRLFRDSTTAQRIGWAYLAAHPDEHSLPALLHAAFGQTSLPRRQSALEALVAARRQSDFVTGRLVLVDGMLLSHTEARACALAALG